MLKSLVFAAVLGLSLAVGGYQDQDATDPKWKSNLDALMDTGLLRSMKDVQFQILQVKTQVVAGVNTFYSIQVGQDRCNLTVYTDLSSQNHVTEDTCQLRANLIGGFTSVTDLTGAQFRAAVGLVLNMASNQMNSMYRLVETKMISATQQVVSGVKYHVKMEVARSDCMKGNQDNAICAVASDSEQRYIVDALVLWQAWRTPQYSVISIQITTP